MTTVKFLKFRPSSIALQWQQRQAEVLKGTQRPLSPKESGQLKSLYRKAGPHTSRLVDYAFKNWPTLLLAIACDQQGLSWKTVEVNEALKNELTNYPQFPVVGFLLAHASVALCLMAEDQGIAPYSAYTGLAALWAKRTAELSDSAFPRSLTQRELDRLNRFEKVVGDHADPAVLVDWVFKNANWWAFTKKAEATYGPLSVLPESPRLDFMLQCVCLLATMASQ